MEKVEENKKNLIKKQNEIETYLLFKQLMFYFNFHFLVVVFVRYKYVLSFHNQKF